ncbi:hypothetical protein TSOC_004104 [Tetrabaena socialis]|uniref:Uncharacterized protein n=1 Tax=Tetrabaena socialis TaxID=47790 RepID=A0A2J8A9Y3_9CHLO|nr:hypothetical protein TSOC_004104 [Tetrabaena socialis]|eukprot:PNH09293.1 hypothetical protein TSOC_004104 [Tetrabaena socialis]
MEVAQLAWPEAGDAIDGSALLKVLVPLLWKLPDRREYRHIRQLRVLAELRAVSTPPPLTVLRLSGIPLMAAVGLLRLAAPHLQQLRLDDLLGRASESLEAEAPTSLASALLQCSRLEALRLGFRRPKAPLLGVLSALAQLPALRALEYNLPLAGDAASLPAGLTRLVLKSSLDLDWAMPTLARMRDLADLRLQCNKLRPLQLCHLAGLTALTRLAVKGIWATDDSPPAAAVVLGGLGPLARLLVPLPAQLRSLSFNAAASPSEVAALQLPSGLIRLELPGLTIPVHSKDADGCLCPSAAEALLASCSQLAGRLGEDPFPMEYDQENYFGLDLRHAAAPPSWPDGYGTLFAALQPLALRRLTIKAGPLTLYDVDALVRHLPLLEGLTFDCAVELPSLPLLCRLKRLETLELRPGVGGLVEGWDSELALRAALLVLCAEAPRLKQLFLVFPLSGAQDHLLEASEQAADWLSQELPTLRVDPPSLDIDSC